VACLCTILHAFSDTRDQIVSPSPSKISSAVQLSRGMFCVFPHKYLNTPYDSGLAFVRDAETLRSAMAVTAAYLPTPTTRDATSYTPELSRRARGVEVWAALRSLSRSGVAELVERTCQLATQFADGLRAAGFEVLNDVVLNQVLVSFGDPATTERAIAALQRDGTCWAGVTRWQGRTAMRISVSCWRTTEADVERSLAAIMRVSGAAAQ
jgi:glutamate/tyrosine decarboxylase-like PLP-dependent enzyme